MEGNFITLTHDNISHEHICCAFSDKKCKDSYELKKKWLEKEFDKGYIFRRLDQRAKVFIEYVPAENAWVPVSAPGYLMINCFWVSGMYKGKGYAKALLQSAEEDAVRQGRHGLVTVAGSKKFHFMSDPKWLVRQGFTETERLATGFALFVKKLKPDAPDPEFMDSVLSGECPHKDGVVVYYSNRCPFTQYHIENSLPETVGKRNIPLTVIKIDTLEQARQSPTPATIFSLFYNGRFVTTDLSACMDSRFDKAIGLL